MPTATPQAIEIQKIEVTALRPDPSNPRMISAAELEALTRSIHQFGLALNKISGDWDQELLARLLAELETMPEIDVTVSGFDDGEVAALLKTLDARDKRERAEAFDLDAALEATRRAGGTKRGDCWALGEHRLLCGDATDGDDIARLLDGKHGAMCFTDPPYNVAIGDHGGQQAGARKRRLENDALPPDQWEAFCRSWAQQLLANVEGALYICMSSREWPLVGHDYLGEGPLRAGPCRLPTSVRADLVRLARRRAARLERRPGPGRRLVDPAARRFAAASYDKAARARRAGDREQQPGSAIWCSTSFSDPARR